MGPMAWLLALALVLAALPLFLGASAIDKLTTLFIFMLLATTWGLLAGQAGLVSVGQQAFFGLGAYFALRLVDGGWSAYPALFAGAVGAAVVAWGLSFFVLRLKEGEFAIATWVVAEVIRILVMLDPIVQGETGTSLLALNAVEPELRRNLGFWMALGSLVFMLGVTAWLLRSAVGTATRAIGEDDEAAASLGVRVTPTRRRVYVLASFGAALAGVAWLASAITFLPRTNFGVQWSVLMLFMALVGGLRSQWGRWSVRCCCSCCRKAWATWAPGTSRASVPSPWCLRCGCRVAWPVSGTPGGPPPAPTNRSLPFHHQPSKEFHTMSVQGKTIVITGVSSGIGSDTAKLLRLQGARVIGVDRNDPMLTLDGFVKADLSTPEAIDAAIAQLPQRIDALCNIAGVPGTAPVDLVAKVNYLGLRHLTLGLLDRMAGGSVVNIASILGAEWPARLEPHRALGQTASFAEGQAWLDQHPVAQETCYQYFKEALIVWTYTQSQKLFMQHNVRMNCVAPGPVFTPILGDFVQMLGNERVEKDAHRMKRPAFSDEVAPVIAFLCSDASRWVSGINLPVDGGLASTYL